MKTLFALGNPGVAYALTRHNIGFMIADRLVAQAGSGWTLHRNMLLTEVWGWRLVKPLTWMNASGEALVALGCEFTADELLVIADDVSLSLGRLRLRASGSCGGHNGLASVEAALGRREYHRLRVGVGREKAIAGAELVQYVLGEFSLSERPLLDSAVELAADAAACWLREGLQTAQERYNGMFATLPDRENDGDSGAAGGTAPVAGVPAGGAT